MALIRVLAVIGYCLVAVSGGVEIETLTPKAAADKIEDAVTTKLTPSLTEDAKSKTEKRDSADQTGAIFPGRPTKETPFRPIYPSASYYEAPTQIFGPTTVRYTAAEAAPQTYYDKPESGNGIRYAPSGAGHKPSVQFAQQAHRFSFAAPPQVELYQRPAATKSASLGAEQQQQQQQKQQQQQREIFNYGEVEAEGGAIYERAGPQQYQLTLPVHHQHKFQQPQQQQQQQPRVQYIIAIPLSYMRQLQQQQQQQQHQLLVAPPTPSASPSSSSSTTSSSAAPPSTAAPGPRHHQSFMQLLGPLARDHQGLYRPYYQSDAASAPLTGIGTPAGPNPSPPSHQQQQYFQIPASLLLAAAQQLQQQHQQQSQQQAVYAKAAPPPPPPPPSYQQLIYQAQPQAQAPQHHPQLQLQRIFLQPPQAQTSAIYAEQPGGTLYAYPRLKQQQQQKYTPATDSVAAGPTAATAATAAGAAGDVAATTAEAATATRPTAQHLPIVHYNPIYVQAPAEQQQQQQQQPQHHQLQLQQHQFAILPRFSNNNPKAAYNLGHESTPPIHVVRLSAAGAPGHGHGHGHGPVPFHHFHHYQPGSVPLLQQLYHAPQQQQQQYVSHMPYGHEEVPLPGPVSLPSTVPGMTGASPAIIPYFSHPGAVHYGTHLYHPAAAGAATAATKGGAAAAAATGAGTAGAGAGAGVGVGSAATSPKQQSTSGGHSPGGGNNIVKYP